MASRSDMNKYVADAVSFIALMNRTLYPSPLPRIAEMLSSLQQYAAIVKICVQELKRLPPPSAPSDIISCHVYTTPFLKLPADSPRNVPDPVYLVEFVKPAPVNQGLSLLSQNRASQMLTMAPPPQVTKAAVVYASPCHVPVSSSNTPLAAVSLFLSDMPTQVSGVLTGEQDARMCFIGLILSVLDIVSLQTNVSDPVGVMQRTRDGDTPEFISVCYMPMMMLCKGADNSLILR